MSIYSKEIVCDVLVHRPHNITIKHRVRLKLGARSPKVGH